MASLGKRLIYLVYTICLGGVIDPLDRTINNINDIPVKCRLDGASDSP
jgi:hypothetical protein